MACCSRTFKDLLLVVLTNVSFWLWRSVEDDDGLGLEATGKLMGEEKIMTSKRTCVMEEKLGPERVRRHVYLVIPIGLLHELNLLNAQVCNVYLFVCYPYSHGWWFLKIMSAVCRTLSRLAFMGSLQTATVQKDDDDKSTLHLEEYIVHSTPWTCPLTECPHWVDHDSLGIGWIKKLQGSSNVRWQAIWRMQYLLFWEEMIGNWHGSYPIYCHKRFWTSSSQLASQVLLQSKLPL